jgi:chromosomal replication initiator protein
MGELADQDNVFSVRRKPFGRKRIDLAPLDRALTEIASLPRAVSPELVDLARSSLSQLDRIQYSATLADISRHIEDHFRLPPGALQEKRRDQRTVFARQVGMYLCRKATGAPVRSIAKHFRRNHSTTLYGLKLIQRQTEVDAAFRRRIAQLAVQLSGNIHRAKDEVRNSQIVVTTPTGSANE